MGYCGEDTKDDHKKGNEEIEKNKLKKEKVKEKEDIFNKAKCEKIASSLPTRTNIDLQSLKDEMKTKHSNYLQKKNHL